METRNCQNCKKDFEITPDDFGFYEKIKVPPPTFCPDCRFQRRFIFRNNRVFYRDACGLCGRQVLTQYKKDNGYIMYCADCWFSDKWDVMAYGQEYDFSVPFFEQYKNLLISVPHANLHRDNFISSDYCNFGMDFKDCYLLFGGQGNERVSFGNQVFGSKDSLDISFSENLEFCYEDFESTRSNRLFFSKYSQDCVDSSYLIDCRNCMNCFGCVGLVNKQYHIFNEPYSKEAYQEFIKDNQGSYHKHLENLAKLKDLDIKLPHRYARVYKSLSSSGDDLFESKNTHHAFTSRQAEDSKYIFFVRKGVKSCYDNSFQGFNSELLYEIAHGFGGSNTAFGVRNIFNQGSLYNIECRDCSNIFGCYGLRKKSYCILNKQYNKEEYEELVPKIIEHLNTMPYSDKAGLIYKFGEFFPSELSPFAYNETIAQEYFPLGKEEALSQNHRWEDVEVRNYKIEIENENIPDNIQDTIEDVVNKVIACAHAGKCKEQCTEAFKIVLEEFKFYKRMNLPLPRLCPNCRHYQRINQRNPLKLWHRKCMKEGCSNEFETSYAPDKPEKVYCERCYQQEVY